MCVGVSWLPLSASLHSSKCPILIAMFPCSFFSVCADTLFLWLYEFHRDATRHNLRFMFFIIISFVNFCIAHSLSFSPALCCLARLQFVFHFNFTNISLYQFNLYHMNADEESTHAIYLKYSARVHVRVVLFSCYLLQA